MPPKIVEESESEEESGERSEESGEESSEGESEEESTSGGESGEADSLEREMEQGANVPAADRAAAAASTDTSAMAGAPRDPGDVRAEFSAAAASAAVAAEKAQAAVDSQRRAELSAEEAAAEIEAAHQAKEAATLPPEIAAARRQLREAQRREDAETWLAGKLASEALALGQRVGRLSARQQLLASSLTGDAAVGQVLDASGAALRDAVDAQAGSLQSRLLLDEFHRTGRRAPQVEAPAGASFHADADSDDLSAEDAAFRAASQAAERERAERAVERAKRAAAREARRAASEETRRRTTVQFESQRRDVSKQLKELELAPPSDSILRSIFETIDQKGAEKISARELKKALDMLGYEDEKDGRCTHICGSRAGSCWGCLGRKVHREVRPSGGRGQLVPTQRLLCVCPFTPCPLGLPEFLVSRSDPACTLPPPLTHPQVQGTCPAVCVD